MDPLTHFLTGACIGRAGFNRKTAYATAAAVLAAEAADLDVLWGFAGPVEELKHHRGITHTFVAVPVVAAVAVGAVVGVAWLWRRWRRKAQSRPVHWGWLYGTAVIAALSHLLLDWTNNYGVRPFFPFNSHWYAGSFMFILEPELLGILLLALGMPWLLGLADREIGARRQPLRGRNWAIFALAAMAGLFFWRWNEHSIGLTMLRTTQVASEPVTRMALEPYPLNPYRWHAILQTRDFYQTAQVDTWNPGSPASITTDPEDVLYIPAETPAVKAARRTFLGRVYLDWGAWAVVRDVGQQPMPALPPPLLPRGRTWTTVTFNDLRFDYSFLPSRPETRAPLSGWVYIVDGREEAGEGMGDKVQR